MPYKNNMKINAIKKLLAIPSIVSAVDAKSIIKETMDVIHPQPIAEMHNPDSFFNICQQLGLDITIDDCQTVTKRALIVQTILNNIRNKI